MVGLILAGVGTHGVIAYSVMYRTRPISCTFLLTGRSHALFGTGSDWRDVLFDRGPICATIPKGHNIGEFHTVLCEEIQLVADYASAVTEYYAAVRELEAGLITGSADIYTKLRQATEGARALCEAALKENSRTTKPVTNVLPEPNRICVAKMAHTIR